MPMAKHTTYSVNGVEYASLDDVPADMRRIFEDTDGDGMPDAFEGLANKNVTRSTRYKVNGVEYDNLDDVPESFRKLIVDRDGDGMPDMLQASSQSSTTRRVTSVTSSDTSSDTPSNDDPRRAVRLIFIIGGVALTVVIAFLVGRLLGP
jgi:hypothetical protein